MYLRAGKSFVAAAYSKFSERATSRERSRALAVVGIGACFVVWASLFIYRASGIGIDGKRQLPLFDDAIISMRYAWIFSHGSGLLWNPGEYVECYTNP